MRIPALSTQRIGFVALLMACVQPVMPDEPKPAPLTLILQTGHRSMIQAQAFSPDGKWLATGGDDGLIKIWDAATGDVVQELHAGSDIQSLAFGADGKFIAGGTYRAVQAWDWKDGHLLWKVPTRSRATLLEFSPNGRWAAIADDGVGALILWDVLKQQVHGTLKSGEYSSVSSLAFSPDSKRIVVSAHGTMIWDVEKAKLLRILLWENLHRLAFTSDGKSVTGVLGTSLRSFDVSGERPSGQRLKAPFIDEANTRATAFSSDGQWLAIAPGNYDEPTPIKIYSTADGHLIQSLETGTVNDDNHFPPSNSLTFAPDKKSLLVTTTSPFGFSIWNLQTGELRWRPTFESAGIGGAALSRSGDRLLIGVEGVWSFDLFSDYGLQAQMPPSENQAAAQTVRDPLGHGPLVVPGEGNPFRAMVQNGKMVVTDTRTGKRQIQVLAGANTKDNFPLLLISGDGRHVMLPHPKGSVLYDVALKKRTHVLSNTHFTVASAFSPDGNIIGERLHDSGEILLWDVATGASLETIRGIGATHEGFLFSPDSKTLAAATGRDSIALCDVRSGAIQRLRTRSMDARTLGYSGNGKMLLVTDDSNVLQCFRLSDRQLVASFVFVRRSGAPKTPLGWMAWTPDGCYAGFALAPYILREKIQDGLLPLSSSHLRDDPGAVTRALREVLQ